MIAGVGSHRPAAQLSEASPEATAVSSVGLAHQVQVIYDGALVGSKIERSVEPLRRARALTLELIAHSDAPPQPSIP